MTGDASRTAARLEEILETYHKATVELVEALERMDPDTACRAMETRGRCVDSYADEMERWVKIPAEDRAFPLVEKLRWHHLRINQTDDDAVRYIRSLQDEVRTQIVQVGLARKMERLYRPPAPEKTRILNGES